MLLPGYARPFAAKWCYLFPSQDLNVAASRAVSQGQMLGPKKGKFAERMRSRITAKEVHASFASRKRTWLDDDDDVSHALPSCAILLEIDPPVSAFYCAKTSAGMARSIISRRKSSRDRRGSRASSLRKAALR
jgi:hypothetical protein